VPTPHQVLILSRAEVERLLDPRALLDALADGFRALTSGEVTAPPRNQLMVGEESFLIGMPGRRRAGALTVKVVTLFNENIDRGLPAHLATIGLYDASTGECRAFMDGTYITAIRTSAAAAVACDLLARRDARVLAVIGGGVQGEQHLRTFPLVRAFDDIRVVSSRHDDARRLAAAHTGARAVENPREAVSGADVVALATNAPQPVVEAGWIAAGTHVSSVGYRPPSGELPRDLAEASRVFVETRLAFEPVPVGCAELEGIDPARGTELGEILLGAAPGRERDDEITVYKAMGHVIEDIVAAELVLAEAERAGAGTRVAL
jgi:alanine dehydrogenase